MFSVELSEKLIKLLQCRFRTGGIHLAKVWHLKSISLEKAMYSALKNGSGLPPFQGSPVWLLDHGIKSRVTNSRVLVSVTLPSQNRVAPGTWEDEK